MHLYLRVKNRDRTVFLNCDTADSGRKLKMKIGEAIGEKPEKIKIWIPATSGEEAFVPLDDDYLLADKGIRDDNAFLAFTVGDEKVQVIDLSKPLPAEKTK